MKSRIVTLLALLSCMACHRSGGGPSVYSDWMSTLGDDIPACSMSIPGAHDACTAGVDAEYEFFRTQVLDIQRLWDAGVRAFDLRPAANDTMMEIYHIHADTHTSFEEVTGVLAENLHDHPGEFAVVIFRHEDEGDTSGDWGELMGGFLNSLRDSLAIDFREDLTLGELRGHIVFIGRTQYEGGPVGAYISGWSEVWSDGPASVTGSGGDVFRLYVQDYYAPEGREDKLRYVFELMDSTAMKPVWTVNHTSGYVRSGYGENSVNVNSAVADHIIGMDGKAGIVMMDFAGVDTVSAASLCDGTLTMMDMNVAGAKLVDAVISANFR